ncbi:MAG TPA: mandelate racemase/muconate lactonizing enzyme family protein [Dehalococcoidia bacterium]|jgi:galactonate dehydratase|nr:mandelate racemase/muconate lactonizing enzyme family protein [Dehalococcoidia bacterium]
MNLKIKSIKAYPVWIGNRNQLLVKIETDKDIYGWGESGLSSRELAVKSALLHFENFLKGQDPFKIGRIWQEIYRSQYFEGGRVLTAAMSAIDIALHDIKAKALNVPVYELIGGKQRDFVPAFASTAAPPGEKMIDLAKELMEKNWKCIRLSPSQKPDHSEIIYEPREALSETAEWLTKARAELGNEIVLGVDMHHRLNVAEAASFCNKMPPGTIDFLEEPIRDENPTSYQSLRRMTSIPFAIGEEFASKWQFLPYIENDITQFARLDICNVGGFTEALKVAGWCETHYIDLMPHNPLGPICTAASVHLGAAIPNFSWLEARNTPSEKLGSDNDNIFTQQVKLEGAMYPVPSTPGLGVDVNEEIIKELEFKQWEATHLQRTDGSITNW